MKLFIKDWKWQKLRVIPGILIKDKEGEIQQK